MPSARGAFDYFSKPYDVDQIKLVVSRALQQKRLAEENRALLPRGPPKYRLENIVGRSEGHAPGLQDRRPGRRQRRHPC